MTVLLGVVVGSGIVLSKLLGHQFNSFWLPSSPEKLAVILMGLLLSVTSSFLLFDYESPFVLYIYCLDYYIMWVFPSWVPLVVQYDSSVFIRCLWIGGLLSLSGFAIIIMVGAWQHSWHWSSSWDLCHLQSRLLKLQSPLSVTHAFQGHTYRKSTLSPIRPHLILSMSSTLGWISTQINVPMEAILIQTTHLFWAYSCLCICNGT